MAYREWRAQPLQMALFLSSIVLGLAALVSVRSFSVNIADAIDAQAKTLLGADLAIVSRSPFHPELEATMAAIPGRQSREWRFATMAYFPKAGDSRLSQIRAVEGEFPFYGTMATLPLSAAVEYQAGPPQALIEESLLLQFDAQVGDVVRIGELDFRIAGRLQKLPGESVVLAELAPRILIPMRHLERTGLIRFGSRVFYRQTFAYPPGFDDRELLAKLSALAERFGFRYDTVETRKESIGRKMGNLFHFLNLVGLAALLLGGIGIGSSMHVYMTRKLGNVAVLRCLGASSTATFALYLLQAILLGLVGGIVGAGLGIAIQFWLPAVLGDVIPVDIVVRISWPTVIGGVVLGVATTLLFSLYPLMSVWRVSPLSTLRAHIEPVVASRRLSYALHVVGAAVITAFSLATAQKWKYGLGLAGALLAAFFLLMGLARVMTGLLRRLRLQRLPYVIRQGLSNLYRPQNQTVVLILALGVGTFLIMTLYLAKTQVLRQVQRSEDGNNANMVLFDIQVDQRDDVVRMLQGMRLPILQEVPIVNMRLSAINHTPVEEIRRRNKVGADGEGIPGWTLNREYRSTYRAAIVDSETVTQGEFHGQTRTVAGRIPISLEQDIAKDLRVTLGDELVFDVQGIPVTTVITSLRQVDWYKIQPNFFVVFPPGVLETAPQMLVLVTRVPDQATSAKLQRVAVEQFPNLSLIDLTLVLDTMTGIFDNISFGIEFMALFTIFTGLTVLAGSISISHQQRLRENVLLKVLGASGRQIVGIMMAEYGVLGLAAANAGIALAALGAFGLARFVFDTGYWMDWRAIAVANVAVMGVTMIVGVMSSMAYYRQPALEVLRRDCL